MYNNFSLLRSPVKISFVSIRAKTDKVTVSRRFSRGCCRRCENVFFVRLRVIFSENSACCVCFLLRVIYQGEAKNTPTGLKTALFSIYSPQLIIRLYWRNNLRARRPYGVNFPMYVSRLYGWNSLSSISDNIISEASNPPRRSLWE